MSRRRILERLTPSSHRRVLESWFEFIAAIEKSFIHINTAEFSMVDDGAEQHIRACLEAFDAPPEPNRSFSESNDWAEMLDVAKIDPDDLAGTVAGHKLAGQPWNRPVPWDCNS